MPLARSHGVEPWVCSVAARSGLKEFDADRRRNTAGQLRVRHELSVVADLARRQELRWAILKGLSLAEAVYPEVGARIGADVDILVEPNGFHDFVDSALEAGWTLLDRNWPLLASTVPGQLRLLSPHGSVFDVHWHVLNNPVLRRAFRMHTGELLARRVALASGVPALHPVDQSLHVALHASLSGASRLSWLADATLALRACDNIDDVTTRARATGTDLVMHLVHARSRRWLALDASACALPAPRSFRKMCTSVDALSGPRDDPESPSLARAFARSVRDSVHGSLSEFRLHAKGFARRDGSAQRSRELRDESSPTSPLHDVEDTAARELYYSAVADTAN